jgi:acetyltransferase-like isoleucine patch superfamily enzyme
MRCIKTIFWQICNKLHQYIAKPRMILGYRNHDGKFLAKTRIGNTNVIISPQKLTLGDNVYIGHYNYIEASNGVTIGEGCQLASFISITSHSSHNSIRLYGKEYIKHNGKHHGYIKGCVEIGKYTFIGPNSTIMPNTKIGKGSLIAAHSYVKGEFPEFAIIAGNPAVLVGDTRTKDNEMLAMYPELKSYYDEWANS